MPNIFLNDNTAWDISKEEKILVDVFVENEVLIILETAPEPQKQVSDLASTHQKNVSIQIFMEIVMVSTFQVSKPYFVVSTFNPYMYSNL